MATWYNVLIEAAIVGLDGAVCALTGGLDIKPDEVKKLEEFFKKSANNTPTIVVGRKKYQMILFTSRSKKVE